MFSVGNFGVLKKLNWHINVIGIANMAQNVVLLRKIVDIYQYCTWSFNIAYWHVIWSFFRNKVVKSDTMQIYLTISYIVACWIGELKKTKRLISMWLGQRYIDCLCMTAAWWQIGLVSVCCCLAKSLMVML